MDQVEMKNIKIKLPEHFIEEEERCGETISTGMKKIWAVEIDLLSELTRVCDKYGLKYYADGGTLLGALRHKGYIPWDDDIDVTMMREDYDKLCEIASKEFKSPYFFQTSSTDVDCHFHHAKLRNSETAAVTECDIQKGYNQGIWIDILPLDNVPDDEEEFRSFTAALQKKQQSLGKHKTLIVEYIHKKGQGFIPFAKHYLRHLYTKYVWAIFHPVDKMCADIDKTITTYKGTKTRRIANLSMIWYVIPKGLYWEKSWYEGDRYEDFEFLKLPVPAESEKIMGMQYGDWHKLVKGASCHKPKIFDTEKPYTCYTKVGKK